MSKNTQRQLAAFNLGKAHAHTGSIVHSARWWFFKEYRDGVRAYIKDARGYGARTKERLVHALTYWPKVYTEYAESVGVYNNLLCYRDVAIEQCNYHRDSVLFGGIEIPVCDLSHQPALSMGIWVELLKDGKCYVIANNDCDDDISQPFEVISDGNYSKSDEADKYPST